MHYYRWMVEYRGCKNKLPVRGTYLNVFILKILHLDKCLKIREKRDIEIEIE